MLLSSVTWALDEFTRYVELEHRFLDHLCHENSAL